MKDYKKPTLNEEIVDIEDVIANSLFSEQNGDATGAWGGFKPNPSMSEEENNKLM